MENKICIYAISKNERKFVDRWYESMKEADSIVVLDTGSTDGTAERLKELGVIVDTKIIDPWRFDVARNESLKLVPNDCNILFCTDLDEVLEPGWSKVLKEKWIEGKHERGIYKYTWSHLEDGSDGRVFQYDKIHSRRWLWTAPVHELLVRNDGNNDYNDDEILYLFDEIHLHHYPDTNKSRSSYLPLLELRAKEKPDDYYGLIYLSHEYCYRGHYQKSIDLLNRILKDFNYTPLIEASCYLFMGDSYKNLYKEDNDHGKLTMAKKCYYDAINIDPTYIEPYISLAKIYLDEKDYNMAEASIKNGLNKSFRHYTWLERDTSWSYEPWDLLCLATFYSGKKLEAIGYATKALSFAPTDERLVSNVELCVENTTDKELIKY